MRLQAILQALFVTFLWSTSWVLMKIGLEDIPPIIFAGLRYFCAFLVLALASFRSRTTIAAEMRLLSRRDWIWLALLGLVYYTATQGLQFAALNNLPAVKLSLMLNFTTIMIAFMAIFLINEYPTTHQWAGIGVFLLGVLVYFYPVDIPAKEVLGLFLGFLTMTANSISSVLGRFINRQARISATVVTLVSMGIGSTVLLSGGLVLDGMPQLSGQSWLIIATLAVVNTAFAFTLWNHTLRTLSSVESSLINNTMLVQIAILVWIFLGDSLTLKQIVGLGFATAGILVVQLYGKPVQGGQSEEIETPSAIFAEAPVGIED